MDHAAGADNNAGGIPEDLRCKRSDGKQWRCTAQSMPDKTVCEKHYYQAKKRAANSAMRASLKKAKNKHHPHTPYAFAPGAGSPDPYANDDDDSRSMSLSPVNPGPSRKHKGPGGVYSLRPCDGAEESRAKAVFSTPPSKEVKSEEYSERSSDSSEAEGLTCHQCRRNDRAVVVWCMGCDQKGYCDGCIARCYPETPIESIQKMCPSCRGICNCRVCYNADALIKAKVQEIAPKEKLRYLHGLLCFVLPVLKQIHAEQCFEIGVETRTHGIKGDIPRAKVNADEQLCCDLCNIPIFDYHRHCPKCLYDLCLTCCRELRRASGVTIKGDPGEVRASGDGNAATSLYLTSSGKRSLHSTDKTCINFSQLYPTWKAHSDGSIPCGPEDAGGCGSTHLILRRILKINWDAKLVKNAEEMVSGCKVSNAESSDGCVFCMGSRKSQSNGPVKLNLCQFSQRDDSDDNLLYYPSSQDVQREGFDHFHKHWVKGEPVIVKHVLDHSSTYTWDPVSIWRGIQRVADERMKDDNVIVKAIDCLNQSEVDIDLDQFVRGFPEGRVYESGWPQMLKLKDSPPCSALEEFISCHRPEFLSSLPLIEFVHFKWGVLNLAAKLPHDSLQTEVGPNILIAYGAHEELDRDDSVANLSINMGDLVHILTHTADVNGQASRTDIKENIFNKFDAKGSYGNAHVENSSLNLNERLKSIHPIPQECGAGHSCKGDELVGDQVCNGPLMDSAGDKGPDSFLTGSEIMDVMDRSHPGAIWDIFRRQDVPKLNEFLRTNLKEFKNTSSRLVNSVLYPVYHQAIFLDKEHKRRLKEEFRVEPWTFKQHIGEAVFIPAGCPFQVRNLQSSVQLRFDFLSPESLGECARMAQEIRSLPNDHNAKLNILEVGKMSLYAASSAIREIQKIILDPKLGSTIRFEDQNLTAKVSENIERFKKQRQISCT